MKKSILTEKKTEKGYDFFEGQTCNLALHVLASNSS